MYYPYNRGYQGAERPTWNHQESKPSYGTQELKPGSRPSGEQFRQYQGNNPLCFKCGEPGHKSLDQACTKPSLSYPEQTYLKDMIFNEIQKSKDLKPAVQSNVAHIDLVQDMDYDPYSVLTLPGQEPLHGTLNKGKSKENQEDDQLSITSHQGKVQVELEDGTLEDLDLSSYVDVAGIKRRHVQAEKPGEEEQQEVSKEKSLSNTYTAADGRKKITPKGKGVSRKKKALAQIVGMIGEPEVDMRKFLIETNVVLLLFQQMQISPWFRDELSRVALKHWVKFHTEVGGIYQHVWAFVAPHDAGPLSLLLGLQWLESVDAVFKIRNEELVIGDQSKNEEIRVLKNSDLKRFTTRVKMKKKVWRRDTKLPQIMEESKWNGPITLPL
ncbi:hypothetical protein MMC22_004134 [Lobaria immixta]|nr:hypothetical protein [Lobaria immixta]